MGMLSGRSARSWSGHGAADLWSEVSEVLGGQAGTGVNDDKERWRRAADRCAVGSRPVRAALVLAYPTPFRRGPNGWPR
jgi:hypothetical protein